MRINVALSGLTGLPPAKRRVNNLDNDIRLVLNLGKRSVF